MKRTRPRTSDSPTPDIDGSLTTFEGSRRAQLRRWCALTLRQRLEALDQMTDTAQQLFGIARMPTSQHSRQRREPSTRAVRWIEAVHRWRERSTPKQRRVRKAQIISKVLRSMAFEREPADRHLLKAEVEGLQRSASASPAPVSDAPTRHGARIVELQHAITEGALDHHALDSDLLQELHRRICNEVAPGIAGRWRSVNARVGDHEPSSCIQVSQRMRDYELDLHARIAALGAEPNDLWLETLAFAEGRLLSIHPFADHNGRTTRVFLDLLTRRLDLPDIDPTPDDGEPRMRYLEALRSADNNHWGPLMEVWRGRVERSEAKQ